MAPAKKWRCPKCKEEIKAIASVVTHRCKNNKNLITAWELVDDEKKEDK